MVPPTILLQPAVVDINGSILVTSFLDVFDLDGDEITKYEFRDNIEGGGFFEINGLRPAANAFFEVSADQLDQLVYRGGTSFATETISVRVTDSTLTTNTRTTNVTTGNSSPVGSGRNFRVKPGEQLRIDSVVSILDADGDGIQQYGFVDRSNGFDSGRFLVDGVEQAQAAFFFVPASDLSKVTYLAGTTGRQVERLGVIATDGFSFSEVAEFAATTSAQPVVSAGVENEVLVGERLAASQIFQATDADGDSIQHYFVVDRSNTVGGGFWEFKGESQQQARFFRVLQSELDQLFYVGGVSSPQAENIGVFAYDGFEFSDVVDLPIRTVSRPIVTPPAAFSNGVVEVNVNVEVSASELFSAFDADGDPIDRYWLVDRSFDEPGGFFEVNGERQTSGRFFTVSAEEFETVTYVGGRFGLQTENIGVQVLAGGRLSEITDIAVSTLPNLNAPVPEFVGINARVGTVVQASELFDFTDVEGNPVLRFGFFDNGIDGGFFTVNGVEQAAQQFFILDFDQLDTVQYNVGPTGGSEQLTLFLNDGLSSGTVFATATAFVPPEVGAVGNSISLDTLQQVTLASNFQQLDAGAAFTIYQVFDELDTLADGPVSIEDRSARLILDGVNLERGVVHEFDAGTYNRLVLQAAEVDFGRSLDPILVRASTGDGRFTDWERANVNTDPIGTRAIEVLQADAVLGVVVPVSLPSVLNIPVVPEFPTIILPVAPPVPGATGQPSQSVFTYTFVDGNGNITPTYFNGDGEPALGVATPLSQSQRESVRQAFEVIETFINVQFIEQQYEITAAASQIVIGGAGATQSFAPPTLAAQRPQPVLDEDGNELVDDDGNLVDADGNRLVADFALGNPAGDIFFSTGAFPNTLEDVGVGSDFFTAVIRETVQVLGLVPPAQNAPSLSSFTDFNYNTILSINEDDPVFNPVDDEPHPEDPSTPVLYDVELLQEIYGANTVFNSGDTVYTYPVANQRALFDPSGFDTIDMSENTTDETIDLRQGQYSTVLGVDQSLLITYGTVIENVNTGSGNDSIRGNEIGNRIDAGDGNDLIRGGGDNDMLLGGAGDDTYQWFLGDGRDSILEQGLGGTDSLEIHDASDRLDVLEDDLYFRRLGNDLRIDLRPEPTDGVGTILIRDFADTASQVETLRLFDSTGLQIGSDIDLTSVFTDLDSIGGRFQATAQLGANGVIAVPV